MSIYSQQYYHYGLWIHLMRGYRALLGVISIFLSYPGLFMPGGVSCGDTSSTSYTPNRPNNKKCLVSPNKGHVETRKLS